MNTINNKQMKNFKTYLVIAVYFLLLAVVLVHTSCASSCTKTKRYWSTHRRV